MGLTTSQILATYGHLTNQNGRALYVNTKGASTNRFIPAASLNLPQTESGVNPNLISFGSNSQIKYNNYPLYYYKGDLGTSTKGQGIDHSWYLMSPSGEPMTFTTQNFMISQSIEIFIIGVLTKNGKQYLADGNGYTLYAVLSPPKNYGNWILAVWPQNGKITAIPSAQQSLVSVGPTVGNLNSVQYGRYQLARSKLDTQPGDINGLQEGGRLVSPTGTLE